MLPWEASKVMITIQQRNQGTYRKNGLLNTLSNIFADQQLHVLILSNRRITEVTNFRVASGEGTAEGNTVRNNKLWL